MVDAARVQEVAESLAAAHVTPPVWDAELHWRGTPRQTANFVLALDALNFCFWGEPRWTVRVHGARLNGYVALASALTTAVNLGKPLWNATYLASIPARELKEILRGDGQVPLFSARLANLRETGHVLLQRFDGEFGNMVEQAAGDATVLANSVAREFPSFRDQVAFRGQTVRFLKRAQIVVADLHGALGAHPLGQFHNLRALTAFADYKVPQVLRALQILRYSTGLAGRIDHFVEIEAGSTDEIEIRAATICAVDDLCAALSGTSAALSPHQVDGLLWQQGQTLGENVAPYHRTRTPFY